MKKLKVAILIVLSTLLIMTPMSTGITLDELVEREKTFNEIINSANQLPTKTSISDDRTVYITKTGSKYHSQGCDYLDTRPYSTTVSNAEHAGFSPCKVCNPYGLATEFYNVNSSNTSKISKEIVFSLILGVLLYMLVPFYLKYTKATWYSYNDLKQFVVLNSILVCIIFIICDYIMGNFYYLDLIMGIVFIFINYKLLDSNVIVPNTSLNKEKTEDINNIFQDKEELPMNWWKFNIYFRFPVGILSHIGNILKYNYIYFLDIIYLIFECYVYYNMIYKKKQGYNLIIANIAIEAFIVSYKVIGEFCIELLIALIIVGLIWFLPNYIYFSKRKKYFKND